jgi:hypothetical protein
VAGRAGEAAVEVPGLTVMQHGNEEIEQAARRFGELSENLDPATANVLRIDDLREVAVVADAVRADEARLREAVALSAVSSTTPRRRRGTTGGPPSGTGARRDEAHRRPAVGQPATKKKTR